MQQRGWAAGATIPRLRHTAITKLGESLASEQTIMAIAGHASRRMLDHYSYIRMEAKRAAVEAISQPISLAGGAQNWVQSTLEVQSTPHSGKAAVLTD
jgi:hypothetical protein